ncbi:hypothetical protein [Dokdonella sp.]|uniref:hypothetical protein n=1 Tax=Dokdonella sp. TaxID=2291710 RepID=UPI0037848727
MSQDTGIPMALYKANLELLLRIGTLLHESRQRCSQLGAISGRDAIEQTLHLTERMLTLNDWGSLGALPGDAFWKAFQTGRMPTQASIDDVLGSQMQFAEGLKQAFAQWQQQSADALGTAALPWVTSAQTLSGNADTRTGKPKSTAQGRPKPPSGSRSRGKSTSKPRRQP